MWVSVRRCALSAVAALALASQAEAAGPNALADTFTATTANMTPAGLELRVQIIAWQDEDARAEALAAMAAGADAPTPLAKLPTVGYIWPSESPVGYSIKYAHRAASSDGGERVTLVTDRRLGSYDFKGWSVATPAPVGEPPYSVMELYFNGSGAGTGNLSLASEIVLDEQAGTVALKDGDRAPALLVDVQREAKSP
jgi:hypothetical protein